MTDFYFYFFKKVIIDLLEYVLTRVRLVEQVLLYLNQLRHSVNTRALIDDIETAEEQIYEFRAFEREPEEELMEGEGEELEQDQDDYSNENKIIDRSEIFYLFLVNFSFFFSNFSIFSNLSKFYLFFFYFIHGSPEYSDLSVGLLLTPHPGTMRLLEKKILK